MRHDDENAARKENLIDFVHNAREIVGALFRGQTVGDDGCVQPARVGVEEQGRGAVGGEGGFVEWGDVGARRLAQRGVEEVQSAALGGARYKQYALRGKGGGDGDFVVFGVGHARHRRHFVVRENGAVHSRAPAIVTERVGGEERDGLVGEENRGARFVRALAARVGNGESAIGLRGARQGGVFGDFGGVVVGRGDRGVSIAARCGVVVPEVGIERIVEYVRPHGDGEKNYDGEPFGDGFLSLHFTPRRIVSSIISAIFPPVSLAMRRMGGISAARLIAGTKSARKLSF